MDIQMKVTALPEAGFRAVSSNENIPIFVGKGNTNYVCGNCENALCENVDVGQISGIKLVCPKCGWQNEFE